MAYSMARSFTTGSERGQAEADRAGVGVRLRAERGAPAAEHLGVRAELDVRLEPEDRLVLSESLFIRDGRKPLTGKPLRLGVAAGAPTARWNAALDRRGDPVQPLARPVAVRSPAGRNRQAVLGREPDRHGQIAAIPARLDGIGAQAAR